MIEPHVCLPGSRNAYILPKMAYRGQGVCDLNSQWTGRPTECLVMAHRVESLRCTKLRRDRSEADMPRASEAGRSDENDPHWKSGLMVGCIIRIIPAD